MIGQESGELPLRAGDHERYKSLLASFFACVPTVIVHSSKYQSSDMTLHSLMIESTHHIIAMKPQSVIILAFSIAVSALPVADSNANGLAKLGVTVSHACGLHVRF